MKEQMIPIINLLRSRAERQKTIAYFALGGVMVILVVGFYIFIYESSKIAAQDIEQQRKIGTSDSVISELASLNNDFDNTTQELKAAEKELVRIENVMKSVGDSELNLSHLEYYNKNLEKISIYYSDIRKYNLERLDSLLNTIKDIHLESEEIKNQYIDNQKKKLNLNLERLQDLKSMEHKYREDLKRFENENPDLLESSVLTELRNSIAFTIQQIRETEKEIKTHDKTLDPEKIQEHAEKEIWNMLQINKVAYEEIEKFRTKLENIRNLHKDKYIKQNALIEELKTQHNYLSAKKQLFSTSSNDIVTTKNDSKMAFYVSTNIARFGVILITIFFAQMFISIYRYSIKVSNFYHARADALMLSTQTETFNNADLPELISLFSTVLTPDKIDFGKMPPAGTNETIKKLNSIYKTD